MLLLMFGIIAIFLLAYCVLKLARKNDRYWEDRGVKYIKPLPFIGNLWPMVTKSMSAGELIQYLYNFYPNERYVGIYNFLSPVLLIRDPELIKSITIKNFENFTDHAGFVSTDIDPLWAKNLFSSKSERWKDLRQTLSPVFTSSKMRNMFILMEECARHLTEYFNQQNRENIEVDLKDIFTRYTTDVIASTAFGIHCDSLKSKDNEFLTFGRELTNLSGLKKFTFFIYDSYPTIAKIFKLKFVSDKVSKFFRSVIDETIHIRETHNITRPDMIHLLMLSRKGKLKPDDYISNVPETGFATAQELLEGKQNDQSSFLTNEDITAQAVVFFFGGFDTSSSLMCFTCYELAVNPHVQNKLKKEIINTAHNNEKITYEVLLNMKYLDMVISESLRKWTQGIWLDRKCTKEFEIEPVKEGESKLKINVGDVCWIPVYAIHHDSKYYPNPEEFDPERFSEENKDKIQTSTYIPFGSGPRNCIGSRFALLETKILLYYLLLNYDIVPTLKTQIPLKLSKNDTLLIPEKGFHLGLVRNTNIN